jgi:hypothetical protein
MDDSFARGICTNFVPVTIGARRHPMANSSNPWSGRWLWSTSGHTTIGVALVIGLVVYGAVGASDWAMFDAGLSPFRIMLGSDSIAAILAFAFSLRLMRDAKKRRETINRRLQIIGDANHHVRNALQLIQLSAYSTHDQQVIGQISSGVDRIEWVLRELLEEDIVAPRATRDSGTVD